MNFKVLDKTDDWTITHQLTLVAPASQSLHELVCITITLSDESVIGIIVVNSCQYVDIWRIFSTNNHDLRFTDGDCSTELSWSKGVAGGLDEDPLGLLLSVQEPLRIEFLDRV